LRCTGFVDPASIIRAEAKSKRTEKSSLPSVDRLASRATAAKPKR
jgi:hypothetical protein